MNLTAGSGGLKTVVMLHNSLLRRDLLLAMNRNPLILHRREVHRNVGLWPDAKPAAGQVQLVGAWAVRTARDSTAENLVAKDAADFLGKLGVKIEDLKKIQKQIL